MRTKPETGDRHPAPSSPGRASQHRLCGWAMGAPGLFHQHSCAKDQRLPGLAQVSQGLCKQEDVSQTERWRGAQAMETHLLGVNPNSAQVT